jgi:hypothetical protein
MIGPTDLLHLDKYMQNILMFYRESKMSQRGRKKEKKKNKKATQK